MYKRNHSSKSLPHDKTVTETPPEIVPANEPGEPATLPEDQPELAVEIPSKVSPYDFPPPGEGFFPEIFSI